jgi:hypothetical protein
VDDVFVAVDGTSIPHPVPNPLAFVGGGVDEVYTMDMIVESGVGGAVDDLWLGCDDGVGVRVDFSALEQEDLVRVDFSANMGLVLRV